MTVPPLGGGGWIAPQNCTMVSQCQSASAPSPPCKKILWRLWRLVFSMIFGPSDRSPPTGKGGIAREGRVQGGGGGRRVARGSRAGSRIAVNSWMVAVTSWSVAVNSWWLLLSLGGLLLIPGGLLLIPGGLLPIPGGLLPIPGGLLPILGGLLLIPGRIKVDNHATKRLSTARGFMPTEFNHTPSTNAEPCLAAAINKSNFAKSTQVYYTWQPENCVGNLVPI